MLQSGLFKTQIPLNAMAHFNFCIFSEFFNCLHVYASYEPFNDLILEKKKEFIRLKKKI